MKKVFITTLFLSLFLPASLVLAEYNFDWSKGPAGGDWNIITLSATIQKWKTYSTFEDFYKAEWNACKAVSDWCNDIIVIDWKPLASTKKYCGDDFKEQWSCKDNSQKACSFDFNPVCSVSGKTFVNACLAWNAKIAHNWECNSKTTNIDKILYATLESSSDKFDNKLSKININKLENASKKVDELVQNAKEKKKATQYTFLKAIIENELTKRY